MWRRIKWPVLFAALVLTGFAFRNPVEKYFDIAKSLDIFATLFKEVNAYYVDEVDPEKLIRKGIDGMLETLDPYTAYIAEDEIETFRITTTGQYAGIGALIGIINKKVVITHPYRDFPAFRAGIRVGDEIIAVDGKNVQGKTTSEISSLLKGQPRTDVELKMKRYGQRDNTTVKIKREKITLKNLGYAGLTDPEIGYIRLNDFTSGAAREVSDALVSLKEKGAKKIILDLRDNPGGLLHEAVNIVSLLIPRGQEVVSTKGKVDEWNKSYKTLNTPVDVDMPVVVLVSEGSASASEIVAGSLQDYDRAVLIGKKTFGKGLVQTTRPLSYNAQLKITTAKYYIPSGRCIQALDYAHRHEDGSVDRFSDSLKSSFKTKNGREVFDGGGLDPDINMDDEYLGTVTESLLNAGLVFEYATRFCAENPAPPDLRTFKLSDEAYDKFLAYLKDQKFSYTTTIERNSKQLVEAAKQERYYGDLEPLLNSLKDKIDASKAADLTRFKGEIKEILEEQIAFHYGLNEGQGLVSVSRDKTIAEARKILSDHEAYRKILTPADGDHPKP
ncbi:MAG TPA: S41 family peptidase [Chryseolinea sp.]|nr:S41 family peptidase [Chryseolinea sp.]